MKANEIKLKEIAKAAYEKRPELIEAYRKQRKGNVVIDLPHGAKYIYGETIKNPSIDFGQGQTIEDLEFFSKTFWTEKQYR